MSHNKNQLKKRKDGADQSCVLDPVFASKRKKEKKVLPKMHLAEKKKLLPDFITANPLSAYPFPSKAYPLNKGGLPDHLPQGVPGIEDYMAYDYENEEPTDEARTNEEAYEEM
jgi:hypothetical protein